MKTSHYIALMTALATIGAGLMMSQSPIAWVAALIVVSCAAWISSVQEDYYKNRKDNEGNAEARKD